MFVSSPLRSLLLAWIGIVYLWGMEDLNRFLLPLCVTSDQSCQFSLSLAAVDVPKTLYFTLLLLLLGILFWFSLSEKRSQLVLFLSVLMQIFLIFGAYLLEQQGPLTLSLALALVLEIITLPRLPFAQVLLLALGGYVLLSVGMLATQRIIFSPGMKGLWIDLLQNIPVYLAQLLFLSGYILLYRQLARSHQQLAEAATRIEALTRLTERQRLARDLHDTLAQGVAGLMMQLEVANSHLLHRRIERGQELVQEALVEARTMLASTRRAIDDLRTKEPPSDQLVTLLEEELQRFSSRTGLPYQVCLADFSALPSAYSEPIARFITEGLRNIARHAQARQVWLEVRRGQGQCVILLRDDGQGFAPETVLHAPGHYGLLGLREQAQLAGGQLDIQSAPGQGTTLVLSLALKGEVDGERQQSAAHPGG